MTYTNYLAKIKQKEPHSSDLAPEIGALSRFETKPPPLHTDVHQEEEKKKMRERDGEISARVPRASLFSESTTPMRCVYAKIKAKRIELSGCSIHKSGTMPPAPHSTEYSLDPHRNLE